MRWCLVATISLARTDCRMRLQWCIFRVGQSPPSSWTPLWICGIQLWEVSHRWHNRPPCPYKDWICSYPVLFGHADVEIQLSFFGTYHRDRSVRHQEEVPHTLGSPMYWKDEERNLWSILEYRRWMETKTAEREESRESPWRSIDLTWRRELWCQQWPDQLLLDGCCNKNEEKTFRRTP